MLRITVHDNPDALTFQLEGELAAPWLRELEICWRRTLAEACNPIIRVDLTGVTFLDDAAKACLADMHRRGAEFVAADCLTKDVVREIHRRRLRKQNSLASPRSRGPDSSE